MCVFWLRANFIALTAKNHTFSFRGVIHAVAEIHVPIHLYCPSPCFSTILSVIIAHSSPLNTFFAFTIVLSDSASSSLIFSLVVISLPCSIKYSHTFREADQSTPHLSHSRNAVIQSFLIRIICLSRSAFFARVSVQVLPSLMVLIFPLFSRFSIAVFIFAFVLLSLDATSRNSHISVSVPR